MNQLDHLGSVLALDPRVTLTKLQLRPPIIDGHGVRHEAAELIKSVHAKGGQRLTLPTTTLAKADAAPARTGEPAAALPLEYQAITQGEFHALVARQEFEDRQSIADAIRQAQSSAGFIVGARR